MKKKIGTLYGKPIVEGDVNLVTTNETHINNLQSQSNKEDNKVEYYRIYGNTDLLSMVSSTLPGLIKIVDKNKNRVNSISSSGSTSTPDSKYYIEICCNPPFFVFISESNINKQLDSYIDMLLFSVVGEDYMNNEISNIYRKQFKPITKEEFYNTNLTSEEITKNYNEIYQIYQNAAN